MSSEVERLLREVRRARPLLGRPDVASRSRAPADQAELDTWFETRSGHILDTLRQAVAGNRDVEAVAEALASVWPLVPGDVEMEWCLAIHDLAVALSRAAPLSPVLARAFRRGAEYLRARGDYRYAASHGMRELAVFRALDDHAASAAALHSLAVTYRAQGRLHRVIGCADEILENCVLRGDRSGIALGLGVLGCLMSEVDRTDAAIDYLRRAKLLSEKLSDAAGAARWQVEIGRALWSAGREATARRRLRQVLDGQADWDGYVAAHVRALLTAPCGTCLPASPWPAFGCSDR
ncbi:hypothetical protein [Actinosynnema sp. NPDC023587]|uniref:hypothetical protein n=1 Tax=Actinosynnema sp. NPDC023587 TaxID=3154695 RepID=UPI0033E5A54C